MQKKVLTLHVANLRLTPDLVAVLGAIADQYEGALMHTNAAGLVITVDDYARGASRQRVTR